METVMPRTEDRPPLPLSRLLVLDLTHQRAGPTAVRHLADWGASVIRIEQPAALDNMPDDTGERDEADFQNLHRNKRSLTLNLKHERGREVFLGLARRADVVIENMRSNVKFRLGIDYEAVSAINPRIVYGSISGFGQDGPYAERPGMDQIAQGMGGIMSITGNPGQGPMRTGIPIADLSAGTFLAQGVLIALLEREWTGKGQWVTTSLIESQIAMLDFQAARYLFAGEVPIQVGNYHATGTPTGMFPTADGHINVQAASQRIWLRFCAAIGAPDLIRDPRYATMKLRTRHRAALIPVLDAIMAGRTSAEWLALLEKAEVPCGPIYAINEVFADPQVRHLGIVQPVQHPDLGTVPLVAQPCNLSRHARTLRSAAPVLGQDTDRILAELGYSRAEIVYLHGEGAV
jgi:formyl-CoA transferase